MILFTILKRLQIKEQELTEGDQLADSKYSEGRLLSHAGRSERTGGVEDGSEASSFLNVMIRRYHILK